MRSLVALLLAVTAVTASAAATADVSADELAKIAQNPLANLVTVPFQYNGNFNVGPLKSSQDILNIEPIIPFAVNEDWNLLTRTILPLIRQPGLLPGQEDRFGIGDVQPSFFLSPSKPGPGGFIWGAGAIVQIPTHSNGLGNKNW